MIKFSQEFMLNNLILVEKSKNEPGHLVVREDLPEILYNKAPRIIKGPKWFNSENDKHKPFYGKNICEGCGEPSKSLDRHELYGLYKISENYLIRYEGLELLCKKCHNKIHYGFSIKTYMSKGLFLDQAPMSNSMKNKKLWNSAKGILIDDEYYTFEELC